jgi:hypothetical protein
VVDEGLNAQMFVLVFCTPLHVQLVYYPFFGGVGMANGDEGKIA